MGVEDDAGCNNTNASAQPVWKTRRSLRLEPAGGEQIEIVRQHCEMHGYGLQSKVVGKGAYATVYLAHVFPDKSGLSPSVFQKLERNNIHTVAIKVIHKRGVPDEFLRTFLPRELDNHLNLPPHPNVVSCFEHFSSCEHEFLVLEYCSNGDLLDRINWHIHRKERGLPEHFSKKVFHQLCLAVKHCHDNYVVHRDLKCENVLLDENDNVKLTDFGFSIRVSPNKSLRTACGSYAYAAPEVTTGKAYNGKKADIWSLGVIMFAMVNGRLPFPEHKNMKTQGRNSVDIPNRQFKFQKSVSPDCVILIKKMLTDDPEKRPGILKILKHLWINLEKPLVSIPVTSPSFFINLPHPPTSPTRNACGKNTSKASVSTVIDTSKKVSNANGSGSSAASGDSRSIPKLKLSLQATAEQPSKPKHQRAKSANTTFKLAYAPRPKTVIGNVIPEPAKRRVTSKSCHMTPNTDVKKLHEGTTCIVGVPEWITTLIKKKSANAKSSGARINTKLAKEPPFKNHSLRARLFDEPYTLDRKSSSLKCRSDYEKRKEVVKQLSLNNKGLAYNKSTACTNSSNDAAVTKVLCKKPLASRTTTTINKLMFDKLNRDRDIYQSYHDSIRHPDSLPPKKDATLWIRPKDDNMNNSVGYVHIRPDDFMSLDGYTEREKDSDKNNSAPSRVYQFKRNNYNEESSVQWMNSVPTTDATIDDIRNDSANSGDDRLLNPPLPSLVCNEKTIQNYFIQKEQQYKLLSYVYQPLF